MATIKNYFFLYNFKEIQRQALWFKQTKLKIISYNISYAQIFMQKSYKIEFWSQVFKKRFSKAKHEFISKLDTYDSERKRQSQQNDATK